MIIFIIFKISMLPLVWLYFRPKVRGKKNLRQKAPFIIITNHTDYTDPLIVHMLFPFRKLYYMAAEEVFRNPAIRFFMTRCGAFPVKRGKEDLAAVDRAVDVLREGKIFVITPEGKINRTDAEMLPFKRGVIRIASRTGASILPIYIEKRRNYLRRQKVIIGKLIDFPELSGGRDLTPEEMKEAAEALRQKMLALKGSSQTTTEIIAENSEVIFK